MNCGLGGGTSLLIYVYFGLCIRFLILTLGPLVLLGIIPNVQEKAGSDLANPGRLSPRKNWFITNLLTIQLVWNVGLLPLFRQVTPDGCLLAHLGKTRRHGGQGYSSGRVKKFHRWDFCNFLRRISVGGVNTIILILVRAI